MSSELLIPILIFALLDTSSPTTIGVTVYILLTDKERPASRILIYLLTIAIFYFTVGVLLMFGLETVLHRFTNFGESTLFRNIMAFIGLALLIGSFFIPKKPSKTRKPKSKRLISSVMIGITTGLIEVGTALPYFAAISMMTVAKLPPFEWIPVLVGYNFIMILPPLILLVLYLLFKNPIQSRLERIRLKLEKNSASTLSWVMFIAGIIILMYFNEINISF